MFIRNLNDFEVIVPLIVRNTFKRIFSFLNLENKQTKEKNSLCYIKRRRKEELKKYKNLKCRLYLIILNSGEKKNRTSRRKKNEKKKQAKT